MVCILRSYHGVCHMAGLPMQFCLNRKTHQDLLPGILAFHDHGGNKYFGTRKITKTGDSQHQLMKEHQQITMVDVRGLMKLPEEVMLYLCLMPSLLQAGEFFCRMSLR